MSTNPTPAPPPPVWVRLTEIRAGRNVAIVERAENIVRFRSEPDGQTYVELRDAAPIRVVDSVEAILDELRPPARAPNPEPPARRRGPARGRPRKVEVGPVIASYLSGESVRRGATRLGISPSTYMKVIREAGLPNRRPGPVPTPNPK